MELPPSAEAPYSGPSSVEYHVGKRSIPEVAVPWVCRARAELFQTWIRPEHTVFEFGCGWGWNLGALQCRRRMGHDVAPMTPMALASLGAEFIREPSDLPDASCDVIICHHALEHVLDPAQVLRELRRLITPQGQLLLTVPDERERRYRRYDPKEPNHHLYSWNVQTLAALVTVCGWTVQESRVRRYGYDRRAALWATRLRSGETGFRWIRRAMQTTRPVWENFVRAGLKSV